MLIPMSEQPGVQGHCSLTSPANAKAVLGVTVTMQNMKTLEDEYFQKKSSLEKTQFLCRLLLG